jgi:hypothetical protein
MRCALLKAQRVLPERDRRRLDAGIAADLKRMRSKWPRRDIGIQEKGRVYRMDRGSVVGISSEEMRGDVDRAIRRIRRTKLKNGAGGDALDGNL